MKEIQILIKPASSACNLDCRYCFYKDESGQRETADYGKMSDKVMEILIEKALKSAKICTFAFQGGEPTLAGLDFFRRFVQKVTEKKKEGQTISYSIQTNGYHINEEWIAFFSEHHFLVGVSLDGVRKTHDTNRIDRSGNGTFETVFNNLKKMQEAHIQLHVLCVLNRQTAEKIEAIYRFFMRKELYCQQYIPCLDPIKEIRGKKEYSLVPDVYLEALKKLFDLWFTDKVSGKPVYIRQFENYLAILRQQVPEACTMYGRCSMQNVVEADGSIYPCDFFATDDYYMGNITDIDFEELLRVSIEERAGSFFEQPEQRDERCPSCRWYPLCRGGCKRDCEKRNGKMRNYYCEVYREFFPYVIERMEWIVSCGI